ncbi:MAG: ABC transporter ATP-binding protein/permease [Marinicaulis sp.]|nr:ABC transporter ATP-binding protein/permease [Marinicaulis sp.]NNE41405.1 ABC transporter ATP-binding protein/permease [Marinicaulis sp.]NNL89427.1 ABC transporter ATP-binding protein/permease [Marinicaulis sp.]
MQHSADIDLESRGEATPFGRSIGRMFAVLFRPQMRRWRLRIALAFLLTVAAKGLAVIAPVFMGDGINQLTADGAARAAGMSFVAFFLLFAGSRFLSNALPALRDAFFSAVTQDAQRIISVDAFAHAQKLDLQFHLTRRAGALNRVIERGASAMEYLLRFLAFNIGPTLIELCLASIVLAVRYGIQFSIAAVVTVVVYAVFTIVVTEWRNEQRRDFNEADTKLRGISIDTLSNFETVKSFAAEDRESNRFDHALRNYNKQYVRIMQSLSVLNSGQELIMTGGLLAVLIMAGHGVINGNMQSGDVAAILFMLINIYRPLNILGWAWREIKQGSVDIEKLFNLMDMETNVPDKPGAMAFKPDRGHVQFNNVSFTHEGRKDGLQNLDIDIAGGNFIGVVGPSGAGKSTILKLLFRFYDPVAGSVVIDGQDIRDVNQVSLRTALGVVPQEVVLFNDTLRFNLAYAKPEASEEEIMSAARRAQLGEFIESLPEGLDTRVGERGLKLSGGEKQRVGIARAILLDPPILVLDEATSSLDSSTEEEVQAALREAAKGRTTLAVAHRLSTVANADMIIVLDGGKVIERGTHSELVASNGFYADLWARQSGTDNGASLLMPSVTPQVV